MGNVTKVDVTYDCKNHVNCYIARREAAKYSKQHRIYPFTLLQILNKVLDNKGEGPW